VSSRKIVGLLVAAMVAGCGGRADEGSEAVNAAEAVDVAETAAAPQPLEPVETVEDLGPIAVDEVLVDADTDGGEFELEPTTNLHVAAYQRAYVAAIADLRETRKFDAAVASNELAAQEEERKKVGGAAATPAPSDSSGAAASDNGRGVAAEGATAPAPTPAPAPSGATASPPAPALTPAPTPTIDEAAILSDEHGQWAIGAEASSYYGGDTSPKPRYGAIQATGAPDVPTHSDNPLSWAPKSADSAAPEWITLTYATPVHATAVKVRQSAAPGAIAKVELIEPSGTAHVLWEGIDSVAYPRNSIGWLVREGPRTDYVVDRIRITLQTSRVWGWNELDAVQLVGEP
jgi:hypothetical protein